MKKRKGKDKEKGKDMGNQGKEMRNMINDALG